MMAIAIGPNRFPRRADYPRVADELSRAHDLFSERGWLDDPASYHQDPPPLEEPAVTKGWALGHGYERLWWPSGYTPHLGVPGTDRWLAFEGNGRLYAMREAFADEDGMQVEVEEYRFDDDRSIRRRLGRVRRLNRF